MEQQLRSCLLEGETIRWMGRPSPFCLSRLPFRRSFYLTWLAFAGCSAAAALLLFPPLLDGRRSLFSTVVILAAVLIGMFNFKKNTRYDYTRYNYRNEEGYERKKYIKN